uniref:Large ribosomal subunit protein uL24m n=1 Tax=Phallusia mammillata TaxID=59560 RepID=A0A6F9DLF5_9ASCI|nr:39S ribosomal protein L24, mitochondrial [Phallusia mammillata]
MRLTRTLFKRGWWRPWDAPPKYGSLIKYGPLKWKDYQSPFVEPPYWYKWSTTSPYHPIEQHKILSAEHVGWYKNNFWKQKIIPPDEWLYQVGDKVEILEGKDKGKQGDVTQVVPQGNIIIVGGLNTKYEKRGKLKTKLLVSSNTLIFFSTDGEIRRREEPLQHHEVSLLDPTDKKPVEVEFRVNETGQRVRVSLRTGHVVEWPPEILYDGTKKESYVCGDKDTSYEEACKRTYKPTMEFWEDELKALYNIKDPPRRKTYWY